MSRPYATDEQYERWFVADCCRCDRRRHKAGTWPDGFVCRTCLDRAVRTRGACPGCGQERALPGLRAGDGAAICTDCAGFSQSFACSRCGYEDKLHLGRLCCRCTLADVVTEILDDGSGRIRPELKPLADALLAMNSPLSGLKWLQTDKRRARSAQDLLRRLARGEVELTHEAFHVLQPWRAAAHLRELLMSCGVLPPVDKRVCSLERWLAGYLASIADDGHAQVIQRFATWEILSRLRASAERKPITPSGRRFAAEQIRHAAAFLQWLPGRGLWLASCSQADIDAWHAGNDPHVRTTTRAFLQWCMASKLTRRLQLPPLTTRHAVALPDHERIRHLGRVLAGHDLPLRPRVAAAILLLYAQPVSRIVRIATDDVIRDGGEVLLRIGDPPSPVPEPVAGLLLRWIDSRDNMNTATNRSSCWLFPGRRAGQPMNADSLSAQVNDIGVPTIAGRTAAIRKHVLDMPSPVVADALGYHPVSTARLASQAGSTFSRYAPGDHKRQTAGEGDSSPPPPLSTALRAAAEGLYALEAATGLIIARRALLDHDVACFD